MSEAWIRVCPMCEEDRLQVISAGTELAYTYYCPNCEMPLLATELEYGAKKE